VFEHGVASQDDEVTAPIGVGVELRTVTVVEDETDGAETLSIFDDELPETYIPQVVDVAEVDDGVVTGTDIFVFHDLDGDTGLITDVEDDNETGAVYLDQVGDTSNAIPDRGAAIDDPEATADEPNGDSPVTFEVQAAHPIFDGVAGPGETVPVHENPAFAARAWFGGASGKTIAEVGGRGGRVHRRRGRCGRPGERVGVAVEYRGEFVHRRPGSLHRRGGADTRKRSRVRRPGPGTSL